jgi:hypothetical protein
MLWTLNQLKDHRSPKCTKRIIADSPWNAGVHRIGEDVTN